MTTGPGERLIDDYLALADDSCVAILPHVLRITAELDLAERLAPGPRSAAELAQELGADADALYRLLRALASVAVVEETAPQTFTLLERGHRLRAGSRDSVRYSVLNPDSYPAWLQAIGTIRTGRSVFDSAHGGGFFAHKDTDRQANEAFLARMRERASRLYAGLPVLLDWPDGACVMDVGGGDGFLLSEILTRHPKVRGMLFDRAAVIDSVRDSARLRAFGDRLRLHAGDFFTGLPGGADLHLLCSVLHDWRDDQVVAILQHSRKALAPGGALLVVEMLVPPTGRWHPAVWSDIGMMVLTGGRERTAFEFRELIREAGFDTCQVRSLPDSPFSVLRCE